MTNHEELRRLATEATPGPWTIHTEEVCSPIVAAMELSKLVHGSVFVPVLPMVVGSNGLATAVTGCGPTSVANATYIAAASPDVVLALIDRLAEVEKDAARYQAIRNGLEVDPDNSGIVVSLIDDFGGETLHGDRADAAIDAAIKEQV